MVDLERQQVIDLLPGRDGCALQQWLKDHPGVEILSRDRASAYAQAACEGAPQAVQVADRWHLLKNVREMLQRFFERHRGKIQDAAAALTPTSVSIPNANDVSQQEPAITEHEPLPTAPPPEQPPPEQPAPQAEEDKHQQRRQRYQQVRERHRQGQSIRQIASQMQLSRNAVRRYLRQHHCPDWRPGQPRRCRLDGFCKWIDQQLQAGRDNAAELHRQLTSKGYEGSADSVRRFVTKRLALLGKTRSRANAAKPRSPPVPSSRSLSFDILRTASKRKAEEQRRVEVLRDIDEEFAEVLDLAFEFIALVRKEQATALADWLTKAETSVSEELKGFAQGIRQDEAAVSAAITLEWSNGQVEGQVNRLKSIKRQMYGRASFALLRQRVLHAH